MLLEKTGYIEALAASGEDDAQDRIDNVNELASHLVRFTEENGAEAGLSDYLEEVQLLADIDNYDAVFRQRCHDDDALRERAGIPGGFPARL